MDIVEQANQIAIESGMRSPFRCLLSDMRHYAREIKRIDDAGKALRAGDGSKWTVAYAFWRKADDRMVAKYGFEYRHKMKGVIIRCYNIESMIV